MTTVFWRPHASCLNKPDELLGATARLPNPMESEGFASMAAFPFVGLLLVGTGVVLLFHCSSISHRKKRQRVEDGHGRGRERHLVNKMRGRRCDMEDYSSHHLPLVIVTPPSPVVSSRNDGDSIGSTSDLINGIEIHSKADYDSKTDSPRPSTPRPLQ